ncbi:hypothetical protein AMK59_7189, partial [Oryctes borbonicus]
MLKIKLCLMISSCLVLTYQQDIVQGSLDIPSQVSNVSGENLNLLPSEFLQQNANATKAVAHAKRRAHIWFAMPRTANNDTNDYLECGSSADDFPPFFTPKQTLQGAIIVHIVICIYCFCLIAIVCDQYFIPCVEQICKTLDLSEDVAAATFMAIATSAPELFVNVIGTFVTQSDIGIGTIVGSSMFNTIGVASIGGLAAPVPIKIAWWPVTRDVILYICAVVFLVLISWDGHIFWYEALTMFTGYFVYFFVMVMNERISNIVHNLVNRIRNRKNEKKALATSESSSSTVTSCYLDEPMSKYVESRASDLENQIIDSKEEYNIYKFPKSGRWYRAFFIFTWPIRFLAYYTIPDCRKHPKLFPITFIMCIIWIGANSYLVSWMVTIVGITFGIPDAVLGLTFLAVGGCLPESFSIAILSRKGEGRMGVSNALGANTLNILLSLGLPWFIKTVLPGPYEDSFVNIQSGSLEYTILGLIGVAITLYISLLFTKFHLSRASGAITLACYFGFLALAIVADMVFFK